jgi:hypothetical protein
MGKTTKIILISLAVVIIGVSVFMIVKLKKTTSKNKEKNDRKINIIRK